jgi:hypothetical protein
MPIPGTGQEVTPLCTSAVSTCQGGVFTGIQEWVYEGVVTLPLQCADWVMSYQLCCRNAAITNIANPANNTFYIYATLNNLNQLSQTNQFLLPVWDSSFALTTAQPMLMAIHLYTP